MDRKLTLSLIGLAVAASIGANVYRQNRPLYVPRSAEQQAAVYRGAQEWLNKMRANIYTGVVDSCDYQRLRAAVDGYTMAQAKSASYQWIEMGPDNVGGRVRAICVDPQDHQRIWAGGVSGGLFFSSDGANTWERKAAFDENLSVSSIAILGNGHLYVATGSAAETPFGTGGSGFVGHGIWRSDDNGNSFQSVLSSTENCNTAADWAISSRIKADPSNGSRLWIAASNPGLRLYDEGSNSTSTPSGIPATQPSTDVDVSGDGQRVTAVIGNRGYLSTDGGQNFSQLGSGQGFVQSSIGRLEMAISPDNGNYMYALAANGSGQMRGGWASTDGGSSWGQIWPENVPELDVFGDNQQGHYDNAISVRPGHPDEVWIGGVSLWKYTLDGAPTQLAQASNFPGCFDCVHADVHEIVFADANTAYIGCDGGIFATLNAGSNFFAYNRHLNITQNYSVGYNARGYVLGGAQDNGTNFIQENGVEPSDAIEVTGGDGFDCDLSQLDTNIMFTTIYNGALFRSNDGGTNSGSFYDHNVPVDPNATLGVGLGDFYTNIRLFENPNDQFSIDSVKKVAQLYPGDTLLPGASFKVGYRGGIVSVEQWGTYTNNTGDTIFGPWSSDTVKFQDRVTSIIAAGFTGTQGIWVTRDAENFNVNPAWAKVCNVNGNVNCLEWSQDGDHLFYGTSEGRVFRIDGFKTARTINQMMKDSAEFALSTPVQVFAVSAPITGLAPDPTFADVLVVTLGGYGGNGKVRRSTNALSASPTFTNIWNVPTDIACMPVYDAVIHHANGNIILVGTEYGIWTTDDIGATWTNQSNGIDRHVPVFAIRQQTWNYQNNPIGPDWVTNPDVIYVGTHGRGFFRTESLLAVQPVVGNAPFIGVSDLTMAPNPAYTQSTLGFDLGRASDVSVNVFDLNGRLVRNITRKNLAATRQYIPIKVDELSTGTYLVVLTANGQNKSTRMVVSR